MTPTGNISLAITPRPITNGHFHDFEIESCRAEKKIEIAKRVEVAEIRTIVGNPLIATAPQNFCSAVSVYRD